MPRDVDQQRECSKHKRVTTQRICYQRGLSAHLCCYCCFRGRRLSQAPKNLGIPGTTPLADVF